MKHHLFINGIFRISTLLVIILITSCQPKVPDAGQSEKDPDSAEIIKATNVKLALAAPISGNELLLLTLNRDRIMMHRTPANNPLNFIKTEIHLTDFIQYYDSTALDGKDAIRFYPALKNNNQLNTLLAVTTFPADADNPVVQKDTNIIQLDKRYFQLGQLRTPILKDTAKQYVNNYFQYVEINGATQTPGDELYKKSRLFKWDEIIGFLEENIDNFNASDTSSFSGYTIIVETGYTDQNMSKNFYSRMMNKPSWMTDTSLMGFTVILYLRDPSGQILLNSEVSPTGGFLRQALEVAHLCPRICGDTY